MLSAASSASRHSLLRDSTPTCCPTAAASWPLACTASASRLRPVTISPSANAASARSQSRSGCCSPAASAFSRSSRAAGASPSPRNSLARFNADCAPSTRDACAVPADPVPNPKSLMTRNVPCQSGTLSTCRDDRVLAARAEGLGPRERIAQAAPGASSVTARQTISSSRRWRGTYLRVSSACRCVQRRDERLAVAGSLACWLAALTISANTGIRRAAPMKQAIWGSRELADRSACSAPPTRLAARG